MIYTQRRKKVQIGRAAHFNFYITNAWMTEMYFHVRTDKAHENVHIQCVSILKYISQNIRITTTENSDMLQLSLFIKYSCQMVRLAFASWAKWHEIH